MANKNGQLRKGIPRRIRDAVWKRYNPPTLIGKCYACGEQLSYFDFEIGHNRARTKKGSDKITNLRPICSGCNKAIGNRGTIEAFRKRFFGGGEEKIPTEVIEKYGKMSVITSVDQVPLQLSSLEFEILLLLLDNKNTYGSKVIESAMQFSYIQHFLSDVPAILGNWIRYGRNEEERETTRKWYQEKERETRHNWREAKKAYGEYNPILKKILDIEYGRSDTNAIRNFLFDENSDQNINEVIKEINEMGRTKVPTKKEIEGALNDLQGLNYIYKTEQKGFGVSPYFYKLWSGSRDEIVKYYEQKKKDALTELKKLHGDDWELANQGAIMETAERDMKMKYGDATLDFYLLLDHRRNHQSKYYEHRYLVKEYLNSK